MKQPVPLRFAYAFRRALEDRFSKTLVGERALSFIRVAGALRAAGLAWIFGWRSDRGRIMMCALSALLQYHLILQPGFYEERAITRANVCMPFNFLIP